MKSVVNLEDRNQLIKAVKSYESVVVYGAGAVARSVIRYLVENNIPKQKLHVVVSKRSCEEQILCGMIVQSIEECLTESLQNTLILVSVMGSNKEIMAEQAKQYSNYIITLSDSLCMDLRHLFGDYEQELAEIKTEITRLQDSVIRLTPQNQLNYLVLNILDHCNLNCKGCDHFASIAKERFISYETIQSDILRLSALFQGDIVRIGIMGGEPLLHPKLLDIIQLVRMHFPKTKIQIDTNGILLLQQTDEFWRICRENEIYITLTKYPIPLDFEAIYQKTQKESVRYEFYSTTGEKQKDLYKMCMDVSGGQDARDSFANCFHANHCVTLMEGKIYTCTIAPNVHIFNENFGTKMELSEADFIDIHQSDVTKEQIFNFLANPIPFCRFCDVRHRSFGHEWSVSRKEKEEWI